MSRPGLASEAKVKRRASVPKAGMPSGNSLRVFRDVFGLLRVHQSGRAFFDQRFESDAEIGRAHV